jgi:hypothetical protein
MKTYPVRIEGTLDPAVSRWLWLVKWLLAIPHYFVLAFLWLAFGVLSVIAFFAILFTGRYPSSIFTFTTGVLRWSWRVAFYAYGALGTDRYPPFTLQDVPDYPARLYADHPPHLSRGLVLVKWLLAVPHLLIVAILLGGGPYLSSHFGDSALSVEGGGLIGLLTVIAGFVLLFTGRYPRDLFDLIIGLNRWAYRVAGYFFLMTDEYPPFRLDITDRSDHSGNADSGDAGQHPVDSAPATVPVPSTHQWTAGRVVSAVAGTLLILFGLGALPAGGTALWFDQNGRDSVGYITTDVHSSSSPGYAIASEAGVLRIEGSSWAVSHLLGDVRITGTSRTGTPLFIGIATEPDASAYLAPIEHTVVAWFGQAPAESQLTGSAPSQAPGREQFWAAKSSAVDQVVDWQPRTGDWRVIVLNADGSRAVQADLSVGATVPSLDDLGYSLIAAGLILLLGGALLIVVALRPSEERHRERR